MVFISWNVNGLRACMKKGFCEFWRDWRPDFLCLQETKMMQGQADVDLEGRPLEFWNSAEKKGYSGTAVFTPHEPLSVRYGMGIEQHDREGRLITLEYPQFFLVCCYTPNSQDGLKRLDYRMEWEDDLRAFLMELDREKPVVYCGDLNVAHQEIDLKNPSTNRMNAGFTDQEREKMTRLLDSGFTDTWRFLNPDTAGVYSWWSYRFQARKKNAGWRIDYFIVSSRLRDRIRRAEILTQVEGSDHCPVLLELDLD